MKPTDFYELKELFGLNELIVDEFGELTCKGFFTSRDLIISCSPLIEMILVIPKNDLWNRTGYLLLKSNNSIWRADCTEPFNIEKLVEDIKNTYTDFNLPSEKEFNTFLSFHKFYGTFI